MKIFYYLLNSHSIITVRLRNRGKESWRYNDYGQSIIIERHLLRDGGGYYNIKDFTGKRIVAKGHSEVQSILDHFNIQINNPTAILMQDTSRQFLTTASPKDKYKVKNILEKF